MLRRCRRAVALAIALFLCVVRYWLVRVRGPLSLERRAIWLQSACRRVLASLGIRVIVQGRPPASGLVVANHLGYIDIAIISAAMPCCFVSKMEVIRWPFFGKAARVGGTIFLDRSSLASANTVAALIGERLTHPIPVLLFPEGTSTDGSNVLRFHTRLIQPATQLRAPVTAAAIRYIPAGNIPERELCWYGDAMFLRHLFKLLGLPDFSALVRFGEAHLYQDRRTAAEETRAEVIAMRAQAVPTLR
ncbi:MAG TPA: lysophospholipid acyltransferase family protein [Terracidiphilus sp.]|nr:lysophospholipid acyltransferase family protein [Terracidiphilus sp.]